MGSLQLVRSIAQHVGTTYEIRTCHSIGTTWRTTDTTMTCGLSPRLSVKLDAMHVAPRNGQHHLDIIHETRQRIDDRRRVARVERRRVLVERRQVPDSNRCNCCNSDPTASCAAVNVETAVVHS